MIVMIKPLNWADVVNDFNEMQKRLQSATVDPFLGNCTTYTSENAFHNIVFRKINEIIVEVNNISERVEESKPWEYMDEN